MLLLCRHLYEEIVIDARPWGLGLIVITQAGIRGGGEVRIGIECDKRVSVLRRELFDNQERERNIAP